MRTKVVLGILLALMTGVASADLIIDTGEPTQTGAGWTLGLGQSLAGEITLDQNYTITGIEGWMLELTAGDIMVSIFDDGGNVPGATELFSTTFAADLPDGSSAWVGTNGLNWNLGPGTYWVALFAVDDTWFAMPGAPPSPLDRHAFDVGGGWNEATNIDFGLRVYGDGVVPEPASIGLLGLGLLGLAARRHRARTR